MLIPGASKKVLGFMRSEIEILEVEAHPGSRSRWKTQKEYYLNEQSARSRGARRRTSRIQARREDQAKKVPEARRRRKSSSDDVAHVRRGDGRRLLSTDHRPWHEYTEDKPTSTRPRRFPKRTTTASRR
jgi:hypothetical protein